MANYTPKDEREAQSICERITPRLAHANAAVVLSAVKVLMKYMEMMQQVTNTRIGFSKALGSKNLTLVLVNSVYLEVMSSVFFDLWGTGQMSQKEWDLQYLY